MINIIIINRPIIIERFNCCLPFHMTDERLDPSNESEQQIPHNATSKASAFILLYDLFRKFEDTQIHLR